MGADECNAFREPLGSRVRSDLQTTGVPPERNPHSRSEFVVSLGKRRRRVAPPYWVIVPVISLPRIVSRIPVSQTSVQNSVHKNLAAIPSELLEILPSELASSTQLRDNIVGDDDTSCDSFAEMDEQQIKLMKTRCRWRLRRRTVGGTAIS